MKTISISIKKQQITGLLVLFALSCVSLHGFSSNNIKKESSMKHTLKALPYAMDALEPVISKSTVEFHYGKHHQGYVNNLNNLIIGTEFEEMPLEDIVKKSTGGIYNNAAQDFNHTFFWESMQPVTENNVPTGKLAEAINKKWGDFNAFYDAFSKAAVTLFGSGWVWLVENKDGQLEIIQSPNAGCPIVDGHKPLLVIDVWEHSYYLDKQNRRPDYVAEFKNLINWKQVSDRFGK